MAEISTEYYPYFMNATGALYAWAYTQGNNSVVYVADTCIDQDHKMLKNKMEYVDSSEGHECRSSIIQSHAKLAASHKLDGAAYKLYMHGTAICGLIVSSPALLEIDPIRELKNKYGTHLNVSGIAPQSFIQAIKGFSWHDIESSFSKSEHVTSTGIKVFEDRQRTHNTLINLSGGNEASTTFSSVTEWARIIREYCNPFNLIMASAGNSGCDLDQKQTNCGDLPAILKQPKTCKYDILLRVGAITKDNDKHSKSNYGPQHVDILAPGAGIHSLAPYNFSSVDSGTSLATAIVSGAVALLHSCNPFANATSIRDTILANADEFPKLARYAKNGRVLNIRRAVVAFCTKKPKPTRASEEKDTDDDL